jgi:hypothetical protein
MVVVAGPGSGLSEEPTLGCESVTLESESFPCCPPGSVPVGINVCVIASLSICWWTMSDSRRFTQRIASIGALPSVFLRS